MDTWEATRSDIVRRGDERLLAEWDAAAEKQASGEDGLALGLLFSDLNTGRYWDRRRDEELESRRWRGQGAPPAPVGRNVAAERVRARLSQRELAQAAEMKRDSLAKIERDAKRLTFDEACRLADALRIPLDRFRPA